MLAKRSNKDAPEYLTPVIYHTLLVLSGGPMHGYAISRDVADLTGGRISMGPGTLYGTLQRLSDSNWIRKTEAVNAKGPHAERRRYYELTASGRSVLRAEARRLAQAAELARERAILRGS